MNKLEIGVKYFDRQIKPLEKLEQGDWIDLRVSYLEPFEPIGGVAEVIEKLDHKRRFDAIAYKAGDSFKIFLGVGMKLPRGYEAHVAPRSSTFRKYGLVQVNSVGVVDEKFCGEDDEWFVPVHALKDGVLYHNDRLFQFRVMEKMGPVTFVERRLDAVSRGGDGSTGRS